MSRDLMSCGLSTEHWRALCFRMLLRCRYSFLSNFLTVFPDFGSKLELSSLFRNAECSRNCGFAMKAGDRFALMMRRRSRDQKLSAADLVTGLWGSWEKTERAAAEDEEVPVAIMNRVNSQVL